MDPATAELRVSGHYVSAVGNAVAAHHQIEDNHDEWDGAIGSGPRGMRGDQADLREELDESERETPGQHPRQRVEPRHERDSERGHHEHDQACRRQRIAQRRQQHSGETGEGRAHTPRRARDRAW